MDVRLTLNGAWSLTVLDTFNGDENKLFSTIVDSNTIFNYKFHGGSSLLLRLNPGPQIGPASPQVDINDSSTEVPSALTLKSVELSEPNVLLLDFARYKWEDEDEWHPSTEVLRIDNVIRSKLNLPLKLEAFKQPYSVEPHERRTQGKLTLKFDILSEADVPFVQLAMENAELIAVQFDGIEVPSEVDGWWVDEAIKTIKLPSISKGSHELQLEYSFGILTNIERVYILGNFGVQLSGKSATITSLDLSKLTWGDYTRQQLPFYAGNVSYHCEVSLPESAMDENGTVTTILETPRFSAPVLSAKVGESKAGHIAYPPYMLHLGKLQTEQPHPVTITSYGNRENAFGTLHVPDGVTEWFGPEAWRTSGNDWIDEYNVKKMGILQHPKIRIMQGV